MFASIALTLCTLSASPTHTVTHVMMDPATLVADAHRVTMEPEVLEADVTRYTMDAELVVADGPAVEKAPSRFVRAAHPAQIFVAARRIPIPAWHR